LPVVAARLEGITEAIQHDRNGLLAMPCDAQSQAAAITRLLAMEPAERRSLAERWSRYTLSEYGWDRTADRYLDVMRSLPLGSSEEEMRAAA
jgi:glycosyltransferase involved in cell wall biosynthesis